MVAECYGACILTRVDKLHAPLHQLVATQNEIESKFGSGASYLSVKSTTSSDTSPSATSTAAGAGTCTYAVNWSLLCAKQLKSREDGRVEPGAFNTGFIGSTCTTLPGKGCWRGWTGRSQTPVCHRRAPGLSPR